MSYKLPKPWTTDSEEAGTDDDGNSIYMDVPLYTGDQLIAAYEAGRRYVKDGHYVIRYNDDGEFGQKTGWLYREGGEPCEVTGRPVYVWRPLSDLLLKAHQGWRLVPEVPTQEMCQRGQYKAQEWPRFPLRISSIYQAMLSASPKCDV